MDKFEVQVDVRGTLGECIGISSKRGSGRQQSHLYECKEESM